MIKLDDALNGPIYSTDQLAKFAKLLGVASLSIEQIQKLEDAALGFLSLNELMRQPNPGDTWKRHWPKRTEIAKALEVAAFVWQLGLEPDFDQIEFQALREEERSRLASARSPEEFEKVAQEIAGRLRTGGRPEEVSRLPFVQVLGEIFYDATGQIPTSRRKRTGEFYGPFFEFADSAVRQIDPHRTAGMENIIRQIIKTMKIKHG